MAGLRLSITMEPKGGVPKNLEIVFDRSKKGMKPILNLFSARMMESVEKTFREEGQLIKWKKSGRVMREGGQTLQKTGLLKRSITPKIIGDALHVGTSDKRARLLFKGGVVKPKNAKMLTIPFPGVKGKARSYKNTYIESSKSANFAIIFQRIGKTSRPLFTLKSSVTIPPRPFIEVTPGDMSEFKNIAVRHLKGEI